MVWLIFIFIRCSQMFKSLVRLFSKKLKVKLMRKMSIYFFDQFFKPETKVNFHNYVLSWFFGAMLINQFRVYLMSFSQISE